MQLPGHRSDVRWAALSSHDEMLLTTSKEEVKVWNVTTLNPIRTLPSGYGLCGIFAPGDRHVVIGTKSGAVEVPPPSPSLLHGGLSQGASPQSAPLRTLHPDRSPQRPPLAASLLAGFIVGLNPFPSPHLSSPLLPLLLTSLQVYDLHSASLLQSNTEVHSQSIFSLELKPDKTGFMTASADKKLAFWDFTLVETEEGTKRLGIEVLSPLLPSSPPSPPLHPLPRWFISRGISSVSASSNTPPRPSRLYVPCLQSLCSQVL